MQTGESKIFFWVFVVLISILVVTSVYAFKPIIDGDGLTYVETINVLQGGVAPHNFVPNRIVTTFLGLETIILFSKIFGSLESGWLILNISFYFLLNLVFYKLVLRLFKSNKVAFVSTLFLASNYAALAFGLDYWLDVGGWAFYLISLYLTLLYTQTDSRKFLLYAALAVGIGGLFKEYAFLGVVPIATILIYEHWPKVGRAIGRGIIPALLALFPVAIVSWGVYQKFDYTYASWFSANQQQYVYHSRIVEYIKSLGSLYTVLALLVLTGLYFFIRQRKELLPAVKDRVFVVSVALSVLPVFVWPAITQRILFITVPAALLVSSFLFKKYERQWYLFVPVLLLYVAASFLMDSVILAQVNLPF